MSFEPRREKASPTRVLVVDDNDLVRYSLQLALEQRGFEVLDAADGRKARHLAETHEPHVILLDLIMKGTSGLDVYSDLRRCERTKDIPIIFMTASDYISQIDIQNLEFTDLVLKPYELDFLCERIALLLARKEIGRA